MSEPRGFSYKEVVEDLKERIEVALSKLKEAYDLLLITGTPCEVVSCEDCPANEVCKQDIDKVVKHFIDAIIELSSAKRKLGIILAELTGEEWVVSQEVRC